MFGTTNTNVHKLLMQCACVGMCVRVLESACVLICLSGEREREKECEYFFIVISNATNYYKQTYIVYNLVKVQY